MDKSATQSPASTSSDQGSGSDRAPRQICPNCHKSFKDLKAHSFVHAKERPEKCPIQSCEYHTRGFSRKHDRNRHALNHYRGSLICTFCPGVGTPAEVMYNRLDLFKKHLVERHEVPMKPPNGHRPPCTRSGLEAPGGCSCNVCRQMFLSPDDLYDHIDDCVLRVLNEGDPGEAINEMLLAEIKEEDLPPNPSELWPGLPPNASRSDTSKSPSPSSPSSERRSRRNRGQYPAAWGFEDSQLSLRKRVTAVFNGPERLDRDEVLLSRDLEVRLRLGDGVSYVTDLDVLTLNKADAVFAGPSGQQGGVGGSQVVYEEQVYEDQDVLMGDPGADCEFLPGQPL